MWKAFLVAAAVLCLPLTSQASWVYQFDVGNAAILGNNTVSSSYATLTLNDSTTDLSLANNVVRFQLDLAGNDAKLGTFALNLNGVSAADISLGSISGTGPANPSDWQLFTANSGVPMDGFGKFDLGLGPQSSNNRLTSLTFDLQFTNPSSARIDSVVRGNSGAGNVPGTFYFALEYFPNSGNTGYVGVPDPPVTITTISTPAPPGVVMALLGVATLGLTRLRLRKA